MSRAMRCKFCGCTDDNPCTIAVNAGDPEFLGPYIEPCAWVIPFVCSNPACIDKAYEEAKRDLVAICGVRP